MNLFEKLTNQMKEALDSAASLALHSQNQEITPAHIYWALLSNYQSVLNQALNKMNIQKEAIELQARSEVAAAASAAGDGAGDAKGSSFMPMADSGRTRIAAPSYSTKGLGRPASTVWTASLHPSA